MMMMQMNFFSRDFLLESNPLLLASIVDVLSKSSVWIKTKKPLDNSSSMGDRRWWCRCLFSAPEVWSDMPMTAKSQFVSWSMLLLLLSKSRATALTYIPEVQKKNNIVSACFPVSVHEDVHKKPCIFFFYPSLVVPFRASCALKDPRDESSRPGRRGSIREPSVWSLWAWFAWH